MLKVCGTANPYHRCSEMQAKDGHVTIAAGSAMTTNCCVIAAMANQHTLGVILYNAKYSTCVYTCLQAALAVKHLIESKPAADSIAGIAGRLYVACSIPKVTLSSV